VQLVGGADDAEFDKHGLKVGAWSTGLLDCLGRPSICIMSWCCPCYVVAQTSERVGLKPFHQVLLVAAFIFVSCHFTGPIAYAGAVALLFFIRNPIRKHFRIPGSDVQDIITSFFCSFCVVAQMATHVGAIKEGRLSCAAPERLPGYFDAGHADDDDLEARHGNGPWTEDSEAEIQQAKRRDLNGSLDDVLAGNSFNEVSYETLTRATNGFDRKLGQGAFASVFVGKMRGQYVAVKVDKESKQVDVREGHREELRDMFVAELTLLYQYKVRSKCNN
jgi:Cys-rich protein (TIGR01571 family)